MRRVYEGLVAIVRTDDTSPAGQLFCALTFMGCAYFIPRDWFGSVYLDPTQNVARTPAGMCDLYEKSFRKDFSVELQALYERIDDPRALVLTAAILAYEEKP
jgi:hypothetical protein